MVLKKWVIDFISPVQTRMALAVKLGLGDQMMLQHINKNKPNGRLTKIDALIAIKNALNGDNSVEDLVEPSSEL